MSTDAPNPVLQLAEAFGREHVEKRLDFKDYVPLYDAILQRTQNPSAPDLKDIFVDLDERAIRREVGELRGLIEKTAREQQMQSILSIEEGRAGRQTDDLKRKRHTFLLKPHLELPDFYLRKWWSGLFPNIPGVRALPVSILYPTIETVKDGGENRILSAQGDWQIVKHFARTFWMSGVACDDQDAGGYTGEPDEADRNLLLVGHPHSNHVIDQVTFPDELPLRCTVDRVITDGGMKLRWADGEPGTPRTVYACVSAFPCLWNKKARLWIFEARHDRALEALARYFSTPANLNDLAGKLGVGPLDEFPSHLQLVFSIEVNRQNQLIGADGGIQLVHSIYRAPAGPSPKLPQATEQRPATSPNSNIVPMQSRRRRA